MTTKTIRYATRAEAPALFALIEAHRLEGHLLPRSLAELETHAERFVVVEADAVDAEGVPTSSIVACAELMKLSSQVAEVRSLVVDRNHRGGGMAAELMSALVQAARDAGYLSLCAFTHGPAFFVHMGFSIVPHVWIPEKIKADCTSCAFFRQCEQYAMLLPLDLMAGAAQSRPFIASAA
ncbi:MAG: GNAT family N-acetyltransferase [Acidobacteriota bacterium]|nr:GNAT family N-acetyltransferase [Acidobacteriota bacterium]